MEVKRLTFWILSTLIPLAGAINVTIDNYEVEFA